MITPADQDYKDTKRVRIGGIPLPPIFKQLAEWISEQYSVLILNIILDTIEPGRLPRLNVVFERAEDEHKFWGAQFPGFDARKQRAVRDKLAALAGDSFKGEADLGRLLVIFSCFERVARMEANGRVAKDAIERLRKALDCPDLWKIRRNFENVTFFFYTDAQAKASEASGAKDRFSQQYAALLTPHDEFGYLAKRPIEVQLDSKEVFDSIYKGNWFYYDKDH